MLLINFIEPFIFLFAFTNNMYMPSYKHMVFDVLCTRNFNETLQNCHDNPQLNHEVEQVSTNANMYLGLITIAPNFILPLVMGHYGGTNKMSLNRLIAFPAIILMLQMMLSLSYYFEAKFSLIALVAISGCIQFIGTPNVIKVMATLYISRTCSEKRKTFRFLILEFMFLLSETIGSLYLALFLDVVGHATTLILCNISLIIAMFLLTNTSNRADYLTNSIADKGTHDKSSELATYSTESNKITSIQKIHSQLDPDAEQPHPKADSFDEPNEASNSSPLSRKIDSLSSKQENCQTEGEIATQDFEVRDSEQKDADKTDKKFSRMDSQDLLFSISEDAPCNAIRVISDGQIVEEDSKKSCGSFKQETLYFYRCCRDAFRVNKLITCMVLLSAFGITFSEYGSYEVMVNYLLLEKFDFNSFHTGMIFTITSIVKSTGTSIVTPLLLKIPKVREDVLALASFTLGIGYYVLITSATNQYHVLTAPLFLILEPCLAAFNSKIIVNNYETHLVGALLGLTNSASSIGMSLGIVLSNLLFSATIKTYAGAVFYLNFGLFAVAGVATFVACHKTISRRTPRSNDQ